jgi:hypothetical protein
MVSRGTWIWTWAVWHLRQCCRSLHLVSGISGYVLNGHISCLCFELALPGMFPPGSFQTIRRYSRHLEMKTDQLHVFSLSSKYSSYRVYYSSLMIFLITLKRLLFPKWGLYFIMKIVYGSILVNSKIICFSSVTFFPLKHEFFLFTWFFLTNV